MWGDPRLTVGLVSSGPAEMGFHEVVPTRDHSTRRNLKDNRTLPGQGLCYRGPQTGSVRLTWGGGYSAHGPEVNPGAAALSNAPGEADAKLHLRGTTPETRCGSRPHRLSGHRGADRLCPRLTPSLGAPKLLEKKRNG